MTSHAWGYSSPTVSPEYSVERPAAPHPRTIAGNSRTRALACRPDRLRAYRCNTLGGLCSPPIIRLDKRSDINGLMSPILAPGPALVPRSSSLSGGCRWKRRSVRSGRCGNPPAAGVTLAAAGATFTGAVAARTKLNVVPGGKTTCWPIATAVTLPAGAFT